MGNYGGTGLGNYGGVHTVLVPPAVVGLLGHLEVAGDRRHVCAIVEHPIGLVELADDLLGGVPASGHS